MCRDGGKEEAELEGSRDLEESQAHSHRKNKLPVAEVSRLGMPKWSATPPSRPSRPPQQRPQTVNMPHPPEPSLHRTERSEEERVMLDGDNADGDNAEVSKVATPRGSPTPPTRPSYPPQPRPLTDMSNHAEPSTEDVLHPPEPERVAHPTEGSLEEGEMVGAEGAHNQASDVVDLPTADVSKVATPRGSPSPTRPSQPGQTSTANGETSAEDRPHPFHPRPDEGIPDTGSRAFHVPRPPRPVPPRPFTNPSTPTNGSPNLPPKLNASANAQASRRSPEPSRPPGKPVPPRPSRPPPPRKH